MPSIPPIYRLTLDDWEHIVLYLVVSETTFLGPPTPIYNLSLVSQHIKRSVSIQRNSRLYARIFRFKFDCSAPERRLSERWLTSRCLAAELKKRFWTMSRIRSKREIRLDDLWTCYLMLSENDGKNERQLLQWAGLESYLEVVTMLRRLPSPISWYSDVSMDSLILWLTWMTTTRSNLPSQLAQYGSVLFDVTRSYIIMGYQAPSTFAPDAYFDLPLCEQTQELAPHCSGPSPPSCEIIHYNHKLVIAAPLVTTAAALSLTALTETLQNQDNFPSGATLLPPNRAAAQAGGIIGPTLADVMRFHFHDRIHTPERCSLTDSISEELPSESSSFEVGGSSRLPCGSERYDEDWSRVVACRDPWQGQMPLRGVVFRPGSLAGSWSGRLLMPDYEAYMAHVAGPHARSSPVPLHHKPLYWTLQEHHCLQPAKPLRAGTGDEGDEDVLNAWLPRGIEINHVDGGIDISDPDAQFIGRYETYIPEGPCRYPQLSGTGPQRAWITQSEPSGLSESGAILEGSSTQPTSIDDDDEYEDVASYKTSGVSDIIITGETGEELGDAWGHYQIIGRVRYWDGLITLLRTPRDAVDESLGRWIFKGYLHDRNLVGRWRETYTSVGLVGYEGSFVVKKVTDG